MYLNGGGPPPSGIPSAGMTNHHLATPQLAAAAGGGGAQPGGSGGGGGGLAAQQQQRPSTLITVPVDGGPPFAIPVHTLLTRLSSLAPGVPFPSIPPKDQVSVKRWIQKDTKYEKDLTKSKLAIRSDLAELAEEAMHRQDWLGTLENVTVAPPQKHRLKIRMDNDRTKERERGKRGTNRKEVKWTKEEGRKAADKKEFLIPVRIEFEHEAYKLRDTFTWNLRETIVTPETFASHLIEDLRLPFSAFYKEVVSQIKRHIEEAHLIEDFEAHLVDEDLAKKDEDRDWWEKRISKRRKLDVEDELESALDDEDEEMGEYDGPMTLKDFAIAAREAPGLGLQDEELRVLIKLDITLDSFQLVDKFEWDLSDSRNSPEDFAAVFAADLGLGGEFRTAIAHSIREQLDVYIKSLCLLGHLHGLPVADDDLRRDFLPSLPSPPFRTDMASFTPVLNQLSPDEVERNDKEREREVRRKRRQTKGRGVALPDRDPVKTHRTLVPKFAKEGVHSYVDQRGDMVYPMPELNTPYPIVRPPPEEKPKYSNGDDEDEKTVEQEEKEKERKKNLFGRGRTLVRGSDRSGDATPSVAAGELKEEETEEEKQTKKQKMLADLGLHDHLIDGNWFCANCGVPEECAIGRRKGLSGMNTLCGLCGKYLHRFRKNRPCEYTNDLAYHQRAKQEREAEAAATAQAAALAKALDKKEESEKRLATRQTAHQQHLPDVSVPVSTGGRRRSSDSDGSDSDDDDDDRRSSTGSSSRATAQMIRHDSGSRAGTSRRDSRNTPPYPGMGSPNDSGMSSLSASPPLASVPSFNPSSSSSRNTPIQPPPPPTPVSAPAPVAVAPSPPKPEPLPWMLTEAASLRALNPDDRFDIIPRPRPPDPSIQEWRIRCLDCPGKLYNLGPDETLGNFSVHFKNRQHRTNVDTRLKGGQPE